MGGACSINGGEEKHVEVFGREVGRKETSRKAIILRWIFE
jgi:hypothetical protein